MKNNSYRMKLYPLLPLIFIAAYLFIGTSIRIQYAQSGVGKRINIRSIFSHCILCYALFKKPPQPN